MLLDFAGKLADAASVVTLARFRQPLLIDDKSADPSSAAESAAAASEPGLFDPVTEADREAERVMRTLIEAQYPGHGILGEEFGVKETRDGLTWVLDPIDGTRAFISGLPLWGTLIALYDGAQQLLGVVDQPFLGERYTGTIACQNQPAESRCHSRIAEHVIRTRRCNRLDHAILMSTDPSMFNGRETAAHKTLAEKVRMTRFGGDCYAYCMLASGHVDLIVESSLETYDIQALIPIVQGAGGIVTDWRGQSATDGGQVVAAATPQLHAKALEVLRTAAL